MFLVFALLLLSLGVGLFLSMYSAFFPFFQQISTITQYNSAYYSALSAVERGSLVLKYKLPGFEGSGGFLGSIPWGPKSDAKFSFLKDSTQGSDWIISSRTSQVPSLGGGNTDLLLQTGNSSSYNVLGYTSSEVILLSYDATTSGEQYYTGTLPQNINYFSGSSFTGILRLPEIVYSAFGATANALLCDYDGAAYDCDLDGDGVYDEVKVNWSIAGYFAGVPFKLIPTPNVFYYDGMRVNLPYDSTIRSSRINGSFHFLPLTFGGNSFSPLASSSLTQHNSISANATIKTRNYQSLFTDTTNVSGLELSLGVISLLRSKQGYLYPYLEYSFTFPQPVSNTEYTLDAHGRNRNYDVQIIIKKPTTNKSIGGDFTVIF